MTTASTLDSPIRSAPGQVELAFTLEFEPGKQTALLRTLVLLHRRCCNVTEAEYRSRLDEYDRLDLRLQAPSAHAHCVSAWLSALVDVRRVIALSGQGEPAGTTAKAPHPRAEGAEVPPAPRSVRCGQAQAGQGLRTAAQAPGNAARVDSPREL